MKINLTLSPICKANKSQYKRIIKTAFYLNTENKVLGFQRQIRRKIFFLKAKIE